MSILYVALFFSDEMDFTTIPLWAWLESRDFYIKHHIMYILHHSNLDSVAKLALYKTRQQIEEFIKDGEDFAKSDVYKHTVESAYGEAYVQQNSSEYFGFPYYYLNPAIFKFAPGDRIEIRQIFGEIKTKAQRQEYKRFEKDWKRTNPVPAAPARRIIPAPLPGPPIAHPAPHVEEIAPTADINPIADPDGVEHAEVIGEVIVPAAPAAPVALNAPVAPAVNVLLVPDILHQLEAPPAPPARVLSRYEIKSRLRRVKDALHNYKKYPEHLKEHIRRTRYELEEISNVTFICPLCNSRSSGKLTESTNKRTVNCKIQNFIRHLKTKHPAPI